MKTATAHHFQWRAFTSVLIGLAFLLLVVSGTVLFISPPGRVANWTAWSILGLRKDAWAALHIWFGAIFLAGTALHLTYNFRPLITYFKDRVSRRLSLRREWLAATALCGILAVGTLAKVPPFVSLIAWNETVKESWEQPAERAPIPHAELLTLAELSRQAGIEIETASARLVEKGISIHTPSAIVRDIADGAGISARELYDLITTAPGDHTPPTTSSRGSGPGRKTLAQFCQDEGLDLSLITARLQAMGCSLSDTATLRDIAASRNIEPYELVTILRTPAQ